MATDQTAKALNIASRTIDATNRFMTALYDLVAIERERSSANLTLSSYDAALTDPGASTKHADGAAYQAALTSAAAIETFSRTNFHNTNFDKVRP